MTIKRGSQHRLLGIPETAFNTTPATPTLVEIPITRFRKGKNMGSMRSAQLRQHPFVHNLLPGMNTQDLEIGTELQPRVHDELLRLLMGGAWTGNAIKATDVLNSMTLESQHAPLYDDFTGFVITRGEFTFSAGEDTPVGVTYAGMAINSEFDAGASIATAVTPAAEFDPFVFGDATVEINDVPTPISSITFRLERAVDQFRVLGQRTPKEYVPGDVTLTGSFSVPYEDNTQSTALEAFADAKIEVRAESFDSTRFIDFTIHRAKRINMNKNVEGRGALVQDFDFEAYYSAAAQTVMTVARDAVV